MSIEAMKLARQIIWRYRHETPLGNQPYMIAHEADEAIERIDQALAKQEQDEPMALQMDVIVGNLIREGINKHRARELAEHFIKYTHPQPSKQLTDEQIDEIADTVASMPLVGIVHDFRTRFARAIETAHDIKE